MTKLIDIKIVSDPVCPWCYIGLTRLNNAMKELGQEFNFKKTFIAYQLHPRMPLEGIDQKTLLTMKYGPDAGRNMSTNLRDAAQSENLTINYRNIKKVPNTFFAHLIIKEAQKVNQAEEIYLALFKAFFEKGQDIGNLTILQQICDDSNLTISMEELRQNEIKKEDLRSEENKYRNKGIGAVPAYIINDKKLIEGAQSSEYFYNYFQSL